VVGVTQTLLHRTGPGTRGELLAGVRAMIPWLLGVGPFGLVIGVSAAQADIPTLAGWLSGPLIYAGSAQVATIQLLDAGAAPVAVIVTALVINVRLVLYSAAIAPYWRATPLWWRLLAGYLLIDASFAVGMQRYGPDADRRRGHAYYLGGAALLWLGWLVAIALGALAGHRVPAWLHLEFVVPLFLIGKVVPALGSARARRVVAVSAALALACLTVPMHLGIALGIVAGCLAGLSTKERPQ
jgi:predicted branched-subunit amino acid permease